eukprot:bmy_18958T0
MKDFLVWRRERQSPFWDWEATLSSRQGGASTWSERAATTAHVTHTLLRLRVGVTLLTSEAWAWQVETTPQKSRLSGNESINNNTSYLHLPSPKAPKLGGKKSQQKEPPTENVDIEPGQEKEGGTSVAQGASQEMGLEETGGEHGDDPDVKGKIPPNLVPAKIPEAGMLPIKNASHGVVVFYNIFIL